MDSNDQNNSVEPEATAATPATAVKSKSETATDIVRVGIDLGTNTTVIEASQDCQPVTIEPGIVTSVVGCPKAGIIPGILPSDAEVLFGEEALDYRLHLDLHWPLSDGFIGDPEVANQFTEHLRSIVDPTGELKVWGVVGAPANASPERQKDLRSAMRGFLDRLLIVPEPFLAAMGLREDEGFNAEGGGDPTKHSLIIDIGAGTTDLCLVRGYFPTAEDQVSFAKAGNFVDAAILEAIQRRYPDLNLTDVTVTAMKEKHAFVEGYHRDAHVKVYVEGRPQTLDFAEIISSACEELVPHIIKGVKTLLTRCDSDSIVNVMQNIIVTGGGSQIHGLADKVEEVLRHEGYDATRTIQPADYKRLVARGALKIAENVRDDQWQFPM